MLLMLAVAAVVVAADQAAKMIVTSRLPEGTASRSVCGIRLCHVANRRHPWQSATAVRLMLVGLLLLAAAGFALGSLPAFASARVALGAMLGGATGNLIDGIVRRGVTDFIDLRVWPVFNLADAAIVAGGVLAAWTALAGAPAFLLGGLLYLIV